MKQGQSIRIQFSTKDGKPSRISNILLLVRFFRSGEYIYEFVVGRTDEFGQLTASYKDVEKLRRSCAIEFQTDYSAILEECDAIVKIIVPSEKELISRMRNVTEENGQPPDWAAPWPSNARIRAQEKTIELGEKVTEVFISSI
jgi:hypothetical protein